MVPTHRATHEVRLPEALGQSDSFQRFQEQLNRVAQVNRSVLLIGERGTGKELAAAHLHFRSQRWESPLVTLNCAALAPTLLETELFGHEEGAFTGATRRREGRFEAAHGGTLFLDELGNIPLEVQEKVLRVVEYGYFERVGGTEPVQVDVRLVGATNVDLRQLAATGHFKNDLLDRLSFEVLFLPPLRHREDDIILLAYQFASRMAHELHLTGVPDFSEAALEQLTQYDWPGNIRELKNVVERAVYKSDHDVIEKVEFDPFQAPFDIRYEKHTGTEPSGEGYRLQQSYDSALAEFELTLLQRALLHTAGNQKQAAESLGLSYDRFRWLYRKYKDRLVEEEK